LLDAVFSFLDTGLLHFKWWQVVLYTLVVTHVTIAGVTIFLHRCQAHRALDLHPVVSHFFRMWLWLTTGMVTQQWAAVHRKHHAKCETVDDPHSPQTRGLKRVLLEGVELYREATADPTIVEKYGHGTPDDWIERHLYTAHSVMGVYLMLFINVLLFGAIGITVFAVQMLWIPLLAAGVINGVGHFWGYRNFDAPDASRNIVPWGILIGGEELHNNHHAFATSAKLSNKWYEFDIGWLYIRILQSLGLATVKKVAPRPKLVAARSRIDLEALQAVIHHRYDVMATYASTLRRVCREESSRLGKTNRAIGEQIESARRWLSGDAARWTEQQRAKLAELFAASDALHKLVEMRTELNAIWERSSATREQLVAQLQQWCVRAESSGVHALQELSKRLRSYAV
jgi:stearoyl-CoA desaturase (delta-9 desaturase)